MTIHSLSSQSQQHNVASKCEVMIGCIKAPFGSKIRQWRALFSLGGDQAMLSIMLTGGYHTTSRFRRGGGDEEMENQAKT